MLEYWNNVRAGSALFHYSSSPLDPRHLPLVYFFNCCLTRCNSSLKWRCMAIICSRM